jgi:hypothetical protein
MIENVRPLQGSRFVLKSFCIWLLVAATWCLGVSGRAQDSLDEPPISYSETKPNDLIQRLLVALAEGKQTVDWDEQRGWLPGILHALDVPAESQTLVFSKTSLQVHAISPRNPRALYFNDDVYVGWVPGGDLIELSAVDPAQGAIFYSLKNRRDDLPQIVRDEARCLSCHATSKTQNVPGYLIRSVFAGENGHPHYALGTVTTDHRSQFDERFGGWYVTGTHGLMRHRGNVFARNDASDPIDWEAGANREHLDDLFDVSRYLVPESDLVALMVLEHQTQMHNLITRVSYETRRALHYQDKMNAIFERAPETVLESTQRRIASACEQLLQYQFFSEETKLTAPISGSTDYARLFQAQGLRDGQGRSLRDFDLQQRMFKYPCSYLVHSESYRSLPPEAKVYLSRRMREILRGLDTSKPYQHLTAEDRLAIWDILMSTAPELLAE